MHIIVEILGRNPKHHTLDMKLHDFPILSGSMTLFLSPLMMRVFLWH